MAGRSSTRHTREIQGMDSAGETPPDHGEIGDHTAKMVTPVRSGGVFPSRTSPDIDQDGQPDVEP